MELDEFMPKPTETITTTYPPLTTTIVYNCTQWTSCQNNSSICESVNETCLEMGMDLSLLQCHEPLREYESFLASIRFWGEGVALCAVGVFGLCGNILTIIVLRKAETNRHFNKLLMALAIVDSLLILSAIGETAILGVFLSSLPLWYKMSYPYLFHPLKGMVQTSTIYMVVAVSAERFKAVCHPLR